MLCLKVHYLPSPNIKLLPNTNQNSNPNPDPTPIPNPNLT